MTTVTALSSVNDILDSDIVMVTHTNGSSYKISGADLKKALAVNTVANGNMNPVTSNAVNGELQKALRSSQGYLDLKFAFGTELVNGTKTIDLSNYFGTTILFALADAVATDYSFIVAATANDTQKSITIKVKIGDTAGNIECNWLAIGY